MLTESSVTRRADPLGRVVGQGRPRTPSGGCTMRTVWSVLLALVVVLVLSPTTRAEDKQVTLKGEILCAKCALKEAKKCTTAIVVKEEGKNVVYYFNDKGAKEDYHEEVCGGA